MPKWGFNYSKMAKYRFLIDPNTFFDDSGTSKILSKYGPVTLPIIIYFKKYKKNMETSLEKWEKKFRRNLELKKFEFLETLSVHFLNFWNLEILKFW